MTEEEQDKAELLLCTLWSDRARKLETDLFRRKWFDHRFMHPVEATRWFGDCFTAETRRIIRAHIDPTPPVVVDGKVLKDWHPIKAGDYFAPPEDPKRHALWHRKITSLIKARQAADQTGIPYLFFVRAGLKTIYFNRGYLMDHRTLPEPMLLNGPECFNAVLEAWMIAVRSQIQAASDPRYQVAVNPDHPDVLDHQDWLCKQIARKPNPNYALRKFIGNGLLSEGFAAQRFGTSRVSVALS